ncbi:MAG: hypothetical protein FWG89_03360 [Treponema sp.]|nr:hypothetical protein [Treponema sp.]
MKKKNRAAKQQRQAAAQKRKMLVYAGICAGLCLLILAGVTAFRRIAADRITREAFAADRAAAVLIYRQSGRKPAGMVNGEHFFQEDLAVYAAELRAAVAAHYGRVYNLGGMGASFWDTDFDGSTPREFMNQLALDDLARNMIIIQEARLRGIDTPGTFSELENEREAWNAPTDDIVYGPQTLAPLEFHNYRITGISNALKTVLLENELAPTVDQMRAAFYTLPPATITAEFLVSGIRFSWDRSLPNETVSAAIQAALRQGLSPEEAVNALSGDYPGLTLEDFEIESRYVSRASDYDQERVGLMRQAIEDGSTDFVPAPEDSPALYYLTRKEGGGLYSFEEAPGLGRNKWINDQFEVFIAEKIKSARIIMFTDADFDI